jgi:ABC-type nitrate/sulfonate/bicarbonate transport system substrate-binding protein
VGVVAVDPVYWAFPGSQYLNYTTAAHLKISQTITNETECVSALLAKSLDACVASLATVAGVAQHGGSAVKILGTVTTNEVDAINVNPSIKTWDDLKGKVIAANTPLDESSMEVRAILEQHGLTSSNVTLLSVGGGSDRAAAMESGKTDAAITSVPSFATAAAAGYPTLGFSDSDTSVAAYLVGIPGQSPSIDAAYIRLLKATGAADEWLANPANKTDALNLWKTDFASLKKSDSLASISYDTLLTSKDFISNGITVTQTELKRDAALTAEYTTVKPPSDLNSLVDDRFVAAATG